MSPIGARGISPAGTITQPQPVAATIVSTSSEITLPTSGLVVSPVLIFVKPNSDFRQTNFCCK